MDRRAGIHVFEDKDFQSWMVKASALVFFAGVALGVLFIALMQPLFAEFSNIFVWLFVFALGFVVSFLAHELVHAAFFKLFAAPGSRVRFGANWKAGMIYASAEGVVYKRCQYQIIIIAPSIVVTAALLFFGVWMGFPVLAYVLAVVHLTGCSGDWGYLLELSRQPAVAFCEDTSWGVRFLSEVDAL